jgi:hypothetical protein
MQPMPSADGVDPGAHPAAVALGSLADIAARTDDARFDRAVDLVDGLVVVLCRAAGDEISVIVRSGAASCYVTAFFVDTTGVVQASCSCKDSDGHLTIWCKHRVAVALMLLERREGGVQLSVVRPATAPPSAHDLPAYRWATRVGDRARHIRGRQARRGSGIIAVLCGGVAPAGAPVFELGLVTMSQDVCAACESEWLQTQEHVQAQVLTRL